jgi:hypothetical protein
MAVKNGWPMSINWDDVKDRVFGMKIDLEDIIADTGVAIVYNSQHEETVVHGKKKSRTVDHACGVFFGRSYWRS